MSGLAVFINRAGLFLAFSAVWLLWPEALGSQRLRQLEQATRRFLTSLPRLLGWIVLLGLNAAALWLGDKSGFFAFMDRVRLRYGHTPMAPLILTLGLIMMVSFLLEDWVSTKLVLPALETLAEGSALRLRLADLGRALLVIGFMLQFLATYL
jgi:uncharacterized membrane protein